MQMRLETCRCGKKYSAPSLTNLKTKYLFCKEEVIRQGYDDEILWQASLRFDDLNESMFLRELAWVILSCGFRESVIRRLFKNISECFYNWSSSHVIIMNKDACYTNSIRYFNNKPKISAIIQSAHILNRINFDELKIDLSENPIHMLQQFPYVGPITAYHLAKNIGIPVAKPDRHLARIAKAEGYSDVQALCKDIAILSGDSVSIVDLVLWRYATIYSDYLNLFLNK